MVGAPRAARTRGEAARQRRAPSSTTEDAQRATEHAAVGADAARSARREEAEAAVQDGRRRSRGVGSCPRATDEEKKIDQNHETALAKRGELAAKTVLKPWSEGDTVSTQRAAVRSDSPCGAATACVPPFTCSRNAFVTADPCERSLSPRALFEEGVRLLFSPVGYPRVVSYLPFHACRISQTTRLHQQQQREPWLARKSACTVPSCEPPPPRNKPHIRPRRALDCGGTCLLWAGRGVGARWAPHACHPRPHVPSPIVTPSLPRPVAARARCTSPRAWTRVAPRWTSSSAAAAS